MKARELLLDYCVDIFSESHRRLFEELFTIGSISSSFGVGQTVLDSETKIDETKPFTFKYDLFRQLFGDIKLISDPHDQVKAYTYHRLFSFAGFEAFFSSGNWFGDIYEWILLKGKEYGNYIGKLDRNIKTVTNIANSTSDQEVTLDFLNSLQALYFSRSVAMSTLNLLGGYLSIITTFSSFIYKLHTMKKLFDGFEFESGATIELLTSIIVEYEDGQGSLHLLNATIMPIEETKGTEANSGQGVFRFNIDILN